MAYLSAPLWRLALARRARRGKEDPDRLAERFGHSSAPRPAGPLLWVHALGIGEAIAMLAVIRNLLAARPDLNVLLTTGTRTGAEGLATIGLPAGVIHQYAPVDAHKSVARFLNHWRPDALLLAELDLWPVMLTRLRALGVPLVMANARLTDHRFRGRQKMRGLMADLLGLFDQMLVQDNQTRDRLIILGAEAARVKVAGLLKAAADPLPDRPDRSLLTEAIGGRPLWLAAATERRELPALIATHARVAKAQPGLLMIIAPRQLTDADEAAQALTAAFGACPRRSTGGLPGPHDAVYLADTMGEMGLWYRLSPISFIGHSLNVEGKPVTGKNPFEAVALSSAILHGPCTRNFAESYAALAEMGATLPVEDGVDLADALIALLYSPNRRDEMTEAGLRVMERAASALPLTTEVVLDRLPPP
jgi:3-deoxy-D-manno-octulosonic-acid transferase